MDGPVFNRRRPAIEPPTRYIIAPPFTLAWLLDRYQVTTDKASGIVNDPNDWGAEIGNPRYIIDLVKRITTVSVGAMTIVKSLPPLEEATQTIGGH